MTSEERSTIRTILRILKSNEYFGKECEDYDEDCMCCKAYEDIIEPLKSLL